MTQLESPVYALTVRQPEAALIVANVKDVENRPTNLLGRFSLPMRIAIHAGITKPDPFARLLNLEQIQKLQKCLGYSGAVRLFQRLQYGAIIGEVTITAVVTESDSPWRLPDSRYAYELADAEEYAEPIPMRGYQGLWKI